MLVKRAPASINPIQDADKYKISWNAYLTIIKIYRLNITKSFLLHVRNYLRKQPFILNVECSRELLNNIKKNQLRRLSYFCDLDMRKANNTQRNRYWLEHFHQKSNSTIPCIVQFYLGAQEYNHSSYCKPFFSFPLGNATLKTRKYLQIIHLWMGYVWYILFHHIWNRSNNTLTHLLEAVCF